MSAVPEPGLTVQKLFHKHIPADGGEVQIVAIKLPSIDAVDAVKRSPHLYAWKHTGFAKEAPKPVINPVPQVVGQTGGLPTSTNGIGVLGVVDKNGDIIS